MYKLIKLDRTTTSTGKAKINATVQSEDGVTTEKVGLWSDFPRFADLKEGDSVDGDLRVKDQWTTLYPPKSGTSITRGKFSATGAIKEAMKEKAEGIAHFQSTKEESIRISGTMRDAVLCAFAEYNKEPHNLMTLEELISKWRKWLWFEWEAPSQYPPFK